MKQCQRIFYHKNALYVGIDISKNSFHACGVIPPGRRLGDAKLPMNPQGYEKLLTLSRRWAKKARVKKIFYVIEPCSDIWLLLASFLLKRKLHVLTVRPFYTARIKDLHDNSPLKTDKKDSFLIAFLAIQGLATPLSCIEDKYFTLIRLLRLRKRVIKQKQQLKNFIRSRLSLYFPEFLLYFPKPWSRSALFLMQEVFKASHFSSAKITEICEKVTTISRKKVPPETVKALLYAFENSSGLKPSPEEARSLINLIHTLENLHLEQKLLEKRIASILKSLPSANIVLSIKGVGIISAATILAYTKEFSHFSSYRQFLKFAGLNLVYSQSGASSSPCHISKRGHPELREALYFASLRVINFSPYFRNFYSSRLARSRSKKSALIATSRKLAKVLFAMVKKNKPFDENILNAA